MSNRRQYDATELPQIVKAESLAIHYKYATGDATIHAAGCQHRADEVAAFDIKRLGADDWFYVAPCAKRKS